MKNRTRDMLGPSVQRNGILARQQADAKTMRDVLRSTVKTTAIATPTRKASKPPTPAGTYIYALASGQFYLHGSWIARALKDASAFALAAVGKNVGALDFVNSNILVSSNAAQSFNAKAIPESPGNLWLAPWGDYWFQGNDAGDSYRSIDQGDSWSDKLAGTDYQPLVFAFGNTNEVAVVVRDFTDSSNFRVGLSTDNGDSFSFTTLEVFSGGSGFSTIGGRGTFYVGGGRVIVLYVKTSGAGDEVKIARYDTASWGTPDVLATFTASSTNLDVDAKAQVVYALPTYNGGSNPALKSTDGGDTWGTVSAPEAGGTWTGDLVLDSISGDFYAEFIDSMSALHFYVLRGGLWIEEPLADPGGFLLAGG